MDEQPLHRMLKTRLSIHNMCLYDQDTSNFDRNDHVFL